MSYKALLQCWCCFVITQLKHLHASLECKQADCCIDLHLYTKLPCISEAGSISVHKLSVSLKVASDCREITLLSLQLGSNMKIIKWAPQNVILGHPAVGEFLTQGGINSPYEAAYHAKPIVTIPLIADQEGNAVTVCMLTEMYMLLCYLMVVGVLAGHHGHMLAMVDILFLISSYCWCSSCTCSILCHCKLS